ncbi:phospholipase D-like domain-containing protein [Archangium sp.]|uniref:phospholipase D-like domain-containing protein n=1 Tax=Archangium sp. TaxID=1872627 RepID=UPI002D5AA538|nr:phospholipase D-like domain-containing protein [Archangium sp.]HYO58912.1 phospholipase D-like domain-containing protein [Archangium sp.]
MKRGSRQWLVRSVLAAALAVFQLACGTERLEGPNQEQGPGQVSQAVSTCEKRTMSGGFRTILHFNNPLAPCVVGSDSTRDLTIRNELVRLIDNVPAGSVIRGTWYSLSDTETAIPAALVRAQSRGAVVQVSVDGGAGVPAAGSAARSYFDQLTHKRICPSTTGCLSSNSGAAHTKAWTFSRTTYPGETTTTTYVVWVGSYNMTNGADGNAGFNNSATLYNNQSLYNFVRDYLENMYAMSPRYSDYYDTSLTPARGFYMDESASVYVSPELNSDLVVQRIDADVWTPATGCVVRVINPHFTYERRAVTQQLITMKNGGCNVAVIVNHIDQTEYDRLKAAGIPMKALKVSGGDRVHDKLMAIYAKKEGSTTWAYRVYTGSHNFSPGSLTGGDDIFVRLGEETGTSHPMYDAVLAHFNDGWNSPYAVTITGAN